MSINDDAENLSTKPDDEPGFVFRAGMYEGITEAEALAQVGTKIPTMPWEIPILTPDCPIGGFWKTFTEGNPLWFEMPMHSRPGPSPKRMGFEV